MLEDEWQKKLHPCSSTLLKASSFWSLLSTQNQVFKSENAFPESSSFHRQQFCIIYWIKILMKGKGILFAVLDLGKGFPLKTHVWKMLRGWVGIVWLTGISPRAPHHNQQMNTQELCVESKQWRCFSKYINNRFYKFKQKHDFQKFQEDRRFYGQLDV